LTEGQRYQIAALKKAGVLNKEIAVIVETSESTISRELKRNTGKRGYRPKQAQNKALRRKQNATKAIKMTAEVIVLVNEQIRFDLSPEQVSGRLKEQHGILLATSGYTSIFGQIDAMAVIYTPTCVKRIKNAVRSMAQKINADSFVIG
jgi:IS30 family transposase